MRRTTATIRLGVLAVLVGAVASIGMHHSSRPSARDEAALPVAAPVANSYRFQAFDLFIEATSADGTTEPGLAAWQVEFVGSSDQGDVTLVGIEGGEGGADAAYATPAHYDPEALAGGRVILAAYTLDADAPVGKTRVARLHLRVPMNATNDELHNAVTLMAAGDASGHRLSGRAWAEPMPAATNTDTSNLKNRGADAPSEG